ncbi:MAG: 16S rRNA (guanine(527)-N(7))-methyltransferase RsmG [Coriobacteriia bacterium]|nr:16S rRNA (guanine(527)-N(7))-methyltransferase RsmG [Coriobacteriia bacterium]
MSGEREQTIREAARLGVSLTDEQVAAVLKHLDLVLQANARMNLTAITNRESALTLHVLDSLAAVRWFEDPGGPIADIGSGAGYPGIPLAIALGQSVDLIEAVKKKARFLQEMVEELGGLNGSEVFAMRSEEAAHIRPCHYTIVVTRALATLPSLVELAAPLLSPGGCLLAMKGKPSEEERISGASAAVRVGLREDQWHPYLLPGGERRTMVRYRRIEESPVALPRRPGLAQRKPLA